MRWQQNWADFDEVKHRLAEWKKLEKELQCKVELKFQKDRLYVSLKSKIFKIIIKN